MSERTVICAICSAEITTSDEEGLSCCSNCDSGPICGSCWERGGQKCGSVCAAAERGSWDDADEADEATAQDMVSWALASARRELGWKEAGYATPRAAARVLLGSQCNKKIMERAIDLLVSELGWVE